MATPEKLEGYVHNVSSVMKGGSRNFFDFRLQTENETVRGVCFSPAKRKLFEEFSLQHSPVKISKFVHDKDPDSTDILMSDRVVVEDAPEVSFQRTELLPKQLNIGILTPISTDQLVTIKGTIVNLQQPVVLNQHTNRPLRKREALLVDPHGSIKIILWEDDTTQVEEGGTYDFHNLRLKKNKYTGEFYVNPAKTGSKISTADPFPADQLSVPKSVPAELTSTTLTGEIIGIQKASISVACIKCRRPVFETTDLIVTCSNEYCGLTQKLSNCNKEWFVQAILSDGEQNATVNFYNAMVQQVLKLHDKESVGTDDKDVLVKAFLSVPSITVTFNDKTNKVESVM